MTARVDTIVHNRDTDETYVKCGIPQHGATLDDVKKYGATLLPNEDVLTHVLIPEGFNSVAVPQYLQDIITFEYRPAPRRTRARQAIHAILHPREFLS